MRRSWRLLIPAGLAAALLAGCGGGGVGGGFDSGPGFVTTPTFTQPISEAVYVTDGTSGVISAFSADPTNSGTLTPIQVATGASQVTGIVPTPDGQNLFTFEAGAIDLEIVDHNQNDATVGQIIGTQEFTLTDATTGFTNAVCGAMNPSGTILYVLGTTGAAQVPVVAAFSIGAGDLPSFIASFQLSNTPTAADAPNGITVQNNGVEDQILVGLHQANGVVALGFDGTTFTGPGTNGVATIDTDTDGVASLNGVFYATGPQIVQAFTMTFDGAGAELAADGGPVSATNSTTGNTSIAPAIIAGQPGIMVGNVNSSAAVAAIPIVAGGSLSTQFNDFQVFGGNGGIVGVNALTSDANGVLYTANTDASADSFVFPGGLAGLLTTPPQETPATFTGGTIPNAIAVIGI